MYTVTVRSLVAGPKPMQKEAMALAQKKKRRLKKKYRILRGIYTTIVVIAAAIVIGYVVYKVAVPAPEQKPVASTTQQEEGTAPGVTQGNHTRREQTYTFLLSCPDQVSGNADAIMLVTYDVPNQKVGMLSIPRDTLVDQKNPKINSSLHGGVENLRSVVSDLVGYPIDFSISIDLDGFVELVDAVGGVEFDVPVEMYYNDPTQDLSIFFQPCGLVCRLFPFQLADGPLDLPLLLGGLIGRVVLSFKVNVVAVVNVGQLLIGVCALHHTIHKCSPDMTAVGSFQSIHITKAAHLVDVRILVSGSDRVHTALP